MRVLGWTLTIGADGQRVCTPPGGREQAWVEIRERLIPLVPFRELLARRVDALRADGAIDLRVGPSRRSTTAEGEHAAVVTIGGTHAGELVEHRLAVIYTDDFQIEIDGRAARTDQRAAVREVVREVVDHLPVGLGQLRHRRYWYLPPSGWQGVARGLVTTWYPPDSRAMAWIKVLPARPARMSVSATQLDALVHDDSFASFKPEGKMVRDDADFGPFTCVITRALGHFADDLHDAARRMLITAGLTDGIFVYGLRLDTGEHEAAAHERAFLEMLRSVAPVPTPKPSQATNPFRHWLE
jgi:hypothetical protein